MSKAEKLAAKILSGKSDKNLAFNDLCYISRARRLSIAPRERKSSDLLQRRSGRDRERATAQWKSEAVSGKTGARTAFKV
jgi:hypothetical protein